MIGAWRRLAWATLIAASIGWLCAANAQDGGRAAAPGKTVSKAKAAKGAAKKDPAAAQSAYETGIAAFEAGKLDAAVQQLSTAISNGGLPKAQMAKALYYRGVAHRKQGKPVEAISDLTSALWLKGALVESDRADALQQRSGAYRDAGLPDQAQPETERSKQAAQQAPEPVKAAAPVQTAAAPQRPEPMAEPAPQKSAAPTSGGFFSSLFGFGSAPASSGQATTVKTGTTPAVPSAAPAQSVSENTKVAAAPSAATGWDVNTEITPAALSRNVSAEPVRRARGANARGPANEAGAGYRIQIAAVRSLSEAEAVLARVRQKHAAALANRKASIDEAVVGNMGTLYRIRVGPFADANEPRALCAKLKGDGLDCLIVTR